MIKAFKSTTDYRHNKPVADKVLNREFVLKRPNQRLVGDYLYTNTAGLALSISLYRPLLQWHCKQVYGQQNDSDTSG